MKNDGQGIGLGTTQFLSPSEFRYLSDLVYDTCGINLTDAKKKLLESRLQKRLRILKLENFKAYISYVNSPESMREEIVHMIDQVTTNKTDFFREPLHFDFMNSTALPEMIRQGKTRVSIWSSACSSGEEPFTLGMVMEEFLMRHKNVDYSILASDISTQVLKKAVTAVYAPERAADIPPALQRKYLLRSKDRIKPSFRIVPEIRRKVRFARINLIEDSLPVEETFDLVFCRNVLIYFDKQTQEKVIRKLTERLRWGGYLFIGHSESLNQMNLPLVQMRPTIYQKK